MRGGKGAFALLLALTALLVVAVPASSAGVSIQATLSPDGTGQLFASSSPGSIFWEACAANLTGCKVWARGRETETLSAPAGTAFRVKYDEGSTDISPEWRGRLKQVAPPSIAGLIEANQYISPVPGEWSGGWAGEGSEMQLSACATPTGEGCTTLTDLHYIRRCPFNSSFPIDPQFVGEYLRVADHQVGAGPIYEPAFGRTTPYGGEVWGQSRTTSAAVVGQIAPAAGPPPGECGPAPEPRATISPEGIARVECSGGCSAALLGTRKGRKHFITGYLGEQNLLRPEAPLELQLTHAMFESLGAGKVRLIVEIDGKRLAQRTIRSLTS